MDPLTQEILDVALERLKTFPEGKPCTLPDLMNGQEIWETSYRKHSAAGRAFYNRLEESGFVYCGRKIEPLRGGKLQQYLIKRGDV